MREKSGVIEHLRTSNVRVEEHLERAKHRVESLMTLLEETLSCLQHAEAKQVLLALRDGSANGPDRLGARIFEAVRA